MAKNTDTTPTVNNTSALILPGAEADALASKLIQSGFAEERTFWIGNPADKKQPVYFGRLIGEGGVQFIEKMGAAPDKETGEVPMSEIPTYLFHPLDPVSFNPIVNRMDTVLCSAMVAQACKKYKTLADASGGFADILFRWNGKIETRKGRQLNDISVIHRIVDADGKVVTSGQSGT